MSAAWTTLAVVGVALGAVVALWLGWVLFTILMRRLICGATPRLWRASFADVVAALEVIGWSFRARAAPRAPGQDDHGAAVRHDGIIVVFLHGTAADGSCMRRWIEATRDAGVESPMYAIDHGNLLRGMPVHGARIAQVLDEVLDVADDAVPARLVFVAHSMGGVALRYALAANERLRAATLGVVTVATPHLGTGLARITPVGPLADLAWGAPSLSTLPLLQALVPRVASFASDVDVIVYPDETADAGGTHEVFRGIGHAALLTDRGVAARIAAAVKQMLSRGPARES